MAGGGMGFSMNVSLAQSDYLRLLRTIHGASVDTANSALLMNAVVGRLVQAFQANFRVQDQTRSKYGHNFYTREGIQRTRGEVSGWTGRVVVASILMAHKYYGGRITAKNAKALAIPISETARKRAVSPSLWTVPMIYVKTKSGIGGILAEKQGKRIIPHFLLRKSVMQRGRKYVIPPWKAIETAVSLGIADSGILDF